MQMAADRDDLDAYALKRAKRGDALAVRLFITRFHPAIADVVARLVVGTQRARRDELVQVAVIRMLRTLASFTATEPTNLPSWVAVVAAKSVRRDARDVPPGAVSDDEHTPVVALSDGQRAALVLSRFHQVDVPQLAVALAVDEPTITGWLAEAELVLPPGMPWPIPAATPVDLDDLIVAARAQNITAPSPMEPTVRATRRAGYARDRRRGMIVGVVVGLAIACAVIFVAVTGT